MNAALGLGSIDEQIYRLLREDPGSGLQELADSLGVETGQVRGCLDRLFECKLIQRSFEQPGGFVTVDPSVGLHELLARQHDELLERQRRMAEEHAVLMRLLASQTPHGGSAALELLEGIDAVQQRITQMSREATESVLTFMPGGPQKPATLVAARNNGTVLLDRGVALRTIGLDAVRNDPATMDFTRWLGDAGGEFRTAPSLPTRLIIVDVRWALVPINPEDTSRGALFLTDPGTISLLTALFEQTWTTSTPLGTTGPADPGKLTPGEQALLALIAQGHTDESAANQLNISPRTARRMMACLLERLGARSRFEAGLKAAQRGWL